ncbi:MAG: hypothetical protein NT027_03530 [Proteobacteria bacterium]|nr:hypothetical protein [Pseudomonadota bacterium]
MSQPHNQDWFIKAVLNELKLKTDFVISLKMALGEKDKNRPDSISEIGTRLKTLENTLKFRLSILSPDRKGAWFRAASATSSPFKESMYTESVLSIYDDDKVAFVRKGLINCWNSKSLLSYPLKSSDQCLWKILLTINFELNQIDNFSPNQPPLTSLPECLPPSLESRSLRAFMSNVKAELITHQQKLATCYASLLSSSEKFWQRQALDFTSKPNSRTTKDSWQQFNQQDDFQYSSRKSSTLHRPKLKNSADLEALKFMGFSDFPDFGQLKQKYHQMALEMHPDRPMGNELRFKLLNRCYKHLMKTIQDVI